jgi:undecaprenyl-diphosphatase
MSVLHAIVLGAVQGLTEFIPISSSGHLVLVPEALGWDQPGLAFDVMLHVASLVALLGYFRKDLVALVRGVVTGDRAARRLAALLAIGTIPAAIAGLVLNDYFEEAFTDAKAAAIQLLFTAAILIGAELLHRRNERRPEKARTIDDLTPVDAGVIGVAQAISILPGISRSGSTIAAGLGLKMDRDDSARFAFLLAIPALFGAALVKVPDMGGAELSSTAAIAGFVASLITSYAAIAGLIRYLRRRSLYPFAAYCVVAGLAFYAYV